MEDDYSHLVPDSDGLGLDLCFELCRRLEPPELTSKGEVGLFRLLFVIMAQTLHLCFPRLGANQYNMC